MQECRVQKLVVTAFSLGVLGGLSVTPAGLVFSKEQPRGVTTLLSWSLTRARIDGV